MFKIGEFSKLSMISVRMLRYFDSEGLLKPEYTDKFTGYRYYTTGQLKKAGLIKRYGSMGIRIADIREIITEKTSAAKILTKYLAEKEAEAGNIQRQINMLKDAVLQIERNDFMKTYNVQVKTMPERIVASYTEKIKKYSDEGAAWSNIYRLMSEKNLACDGYAAAIYIDSEYRESDPTVELQKGVLKSFESGNGLICKSIPETKAACSVFTGEYSQISDVMAVIMGYIEENGMKASGNAFLVYHVSPSENPDPSQWISELCVPVNDQ